MACCLCFFQGSKSWIAVLVPILAVFASFSSGPGTLSISITFSMLLILLSTLFLSKQKPALVDNHNSMLEEAEMAQEKQEKALFTSAGNSPDEAGEVVSETGTTTTTTNAQVKELVENGDGFLIRSQDFYSESDHFSSTSSDEEFHSSDVEWPYNPGQRRMDCSDDSISDEESLIELDIPDVNEMNEEDNLIEIDIYMGSIKCSRFEI
ncbi:hypothetical protein Pfo_014374 [Paulownia fortunei]|nr:hypothetical protein Pfo_014374 [Paulownia fortunei]